MSELERHIHELSNPNLRLAAIERLGASSDPAALEPLLKALGSHRGDVRAAAAKALGELRDGRALPALSASARADPYGAVAFWASVAASTMDSSEHPAPSGSPSEIMLAQARRAPMTREGARYWIARFVTDFRDRDVCPAAIEAFEALGSHAIDAAIDALLARSHSAEHFAPIGIDRICAGLVERMKRAGTDSPRCVRLLVCDHHDHPACIGAVSAFLRDATVDRRAALREITRAQAPAMQPLVVRELEAAALDEEPALADIAGDLLRARGAAVPQRAASSIRTARTPWLPRAMDPGVRALSRPLSERSVAPLLQAMSISMGGSAEVEGPRATMEKLPSSSPEWERARTTTSWRTSDIRATLVSEDEWHRHEGGGSSQTLTFDFAGEVSIAIFHGMSFYVVRGPEGLTSRAEHAFIEALLSLGWESGLSWREGHVLLSPFRASVRFLTSALSWEVLLPADEGIFCFLGSSAQVIDGMLFVWTYCEHENAGGSPFVFKLHRILEDGRLAWTRYVDLFPREHAIRSVDGRLEVRAGFTEKLGDEDKRAEWRIIDPATGLDR